MDETAKLTRGVERLLNALGHAVLTEFPLKSGRRADLLALDAAGQISIVEVKSCVQDFSCDRKWPDYLQWCDRFFFCVSPEFPAEILPAEAGLIVADAYDAVLLNASPVYGLSAARRKALTLRFAHCAAARLFSREQPFAI